MPSPTSASPAARSPLLLSKKVKVRYRPHEPGRHDRAIWNYRSPTALRTACPR